MTTISITNTPFRHLTHSCDFCVVGGGLTGVAAALSAARHGVKTILVQDRPVLGGNSSSEIGVHVIGADRVGKIPHMRETGILEEIRLLNIVRNPQAELSMWDMVLYDICLRQNNLTLMLNCSILHGETEDNTIRSITGWQLSTQTWHTISAKIYADCSGDAILASISGAEFRYGRESRSEYNESIAPEAADEATMGLAQIYYTRDYGRPMDFKPFDWTRRFDSCDDFPWGADNHGYLNVSPWWCEIGGEWHSIHDSETVRDEIFKVNLGLWDHIKNGGCKHGEPAIDRAISQICFVPGRRESYRYTGHHVLTQNDIENEGTFDDVVAYGGWTMDDHNPAGFDSFRKYNAPPTLHHPAPCPYGIPYRALVSRNIRNLMFAGRVASCTHAAMSSTRVMGTCVSMGQAVGTAAAFAIEQSLLPAQVTGHVEEIQQLLLRDDAYVPGIVMAIPELTRTAEIKSSAGDPEPLRDGVFRQVGEDSHALTMRPGDTATYIFDGVKQVEHVALTLDSAMERSIAFRAPGWQEPFPEEMPKAYTIECQIDGQWLKVVDIEDNFQRFIKHEIGKQSQAIRYTLDQTHGAERSRLYGFVVY